MIFRFLYIAVLSIAIYNSEPYASEAISDTPNIVYYEHVPFIDAYKNRDPKTSVSSSTLLLMNKLSNQIDMKFLPTARLASKFDEVTDTAICALFKFKTSERALQYDFSLPVGFIQTHRLYVRLGMGALQPSLLNEQGEVKQISDLFDTYPDATLMYWDKISQGELIDKAMNNVPEKNKVLINGLASYASLAKMISRSRADFAIMIPSAVTEYENESQALDLSSYRIEGVEPISTIHMMCNQNEASTKFLETVNAALRSLYETTEFVAANTLNVSAKEAPFVIEAIEKVKRTK